MNRQQPHWFNVHAHFVDVFIDYEDGRQLYLQASGEEIPDEWFPVRDRLKTYLDSLFDAQEKTE